MVKDFLELTFKFTVLYRSRPLVRVGKLTEGEDPTRSPHIMKEFLEIAEVLRKSGTRKFDPKKTSKELYVELLDEDYGIS